MWPVVWQVLRYRYLFLFLVVGFCLGITVDYIVEFSTGGGGIGATVANSVGVVTHPKGNDVSDDSGDDGGDNNNNNSNDNINSNPLWSTSKAFDNVDSVMESFVKEWKEVATVNVPPLYQTTNETMNPPPPPLFVQLENIDPQYRPPPEWALTKFPQLNVVGFPRAGTSHLYRLLASHPRVTEYTPNEKEDCPIVNHLNMHTSIASLIQRLLFDYYTNHANTTEVGRRALARQQQQTSWTELAQQNSQEQETSWNHTTTTYYDSVTIYDNNTTPSPTETTYPTEYLTTPPRAPPMTESPTTTATTTTPPSSTRMRTVNGCLDSDIVMAAIQYLGGSAFPNNNTVLTLPPQQRPKFILLFRNPPDVLWSQWNGFLDPGLDTGRGVTALKKQFADPDQQYRSPELFHELIAGGTKLRPHDSLEQQRGRFITVARSLMGLVGRDNLLLVRQEDMQPDVISDPDGFLDRLSRFANLDRSQFDPTVIHGMTNCGRSGAATDTSVCPPLNPFSNNNSTQQQQQSEELSSNVYPISEYREMMPATRELINIWFSNDCKVWQREFGIEYPDCIHALDKYE